MIPFILLAVSVAGGSAGLVEGGTGAQKLLYARNIVNRSKQRYKENHDIVEKAVNDFNHELENVGKSKQRLVKSRKDIKRTLDFLSKKAKLKTITVNNKQINLDSFMYDLEVKINYTDEILKGLVKAAGSSFLSYFGAIGIATSIGTASTGTAIASLSGAAAENAILAWFGGGSIAAGGGGVALGSAVLSGIVVGPAVFFTGVSLSKAGEKALTQAKEFESKVTLEVKRMEILKEEIKESMKWLKLYQKVCRIIKNKICKFTQQVKSYTTEEEIDDAIANLIVLANGINQLLEMNILKENTFKLSEKAKDLINIYDEVSCHLNEHLNENDLINLSEALI